MSVSIRNSSTARDSLRPSAMDIESGLSIPFNETLDYGILPYIHFLMFGNGKYWVIPLGFGLLMSAFQLNLVYVYVKYQGWVNFAYFVALFIELWVNLLFGYFYFQQSMFEKVLALCNDNSKKQFYLYLLQVVFGISYALAWFNQAWWLTPQYLDKDNEDSFGSNNKGLFVFGTLLFQFMYTINYYLCGLWVWVMYILYDVFRTELKPKITVETFKTFSALFLEYNTQLETHSKYWRYNHMFRTITGVVIVLASIYFAYLFIQYPMFCASNTTFIITYYGSIWLTYLGAGYINQYIRSKTLGGLSQLQANDDEKIEQKLHYEMTRLGNAFRGMYVSGLRMTTERAISFGTIVITILVFLVRIHMINV
jgi:hypothetical protein